MSQLLKIETVRSLLPRRDDRQAKWHFGRAALVCGSAAMSGAALLSGQAALRSGAGLVQLCAVPEVIAAARTALPEALLLTLPRQEAFPGAIHRDGAFVLLEQAEKAQSLLFGCGVGITDHGRALLERLKQMDAAALQNAVNLAFRGNTEGAKDALSPLLTDPEVQRLSQQMRDGHGGV